MQTFNKLVRDRIPEIIAESGRIPKVRALNDDEYLLELKRKLQEEVAEYLESGEKEELADILEVVEALADLTASQREIRKMQTEKRVKNGGFKQRVFLERAISPQEFTDSASSSENTRE